MADEKLLNEIRAEREAGMTYTDIMHKHNLSSNHLIKVAMNKTLGGDKKYRGRHTARFRQLLDIERKYNLLVTAIKTVVKDVDILGGLINEDC